MVAQPRNSKGWMGLQGCDTIRVRFHGASGQEEEQR